MTIPDPTPSQQSGIDAAVEKANAPIIAANATKPADQPGQQVSLYTAQTYIERCVSGMFDSWAQQANYEAGKALLDAALQLPDETRLPLLAQVRDYIAGLPV